MLLIGLFCGILLSFVMQRGRFCISNSASVHACANFPKD